VKYIDNTKCPICLKNKFQLLNRDRRLSTGEVNCRCGSCGEYVTNESTYYYLRNSRDSFTDLHILAGYLREINEFKNYQAPIKLTINDEVDGYYNINEIIERKRLSNDPFNHINKLLQFLRIKSIRKDEYIKLTTDDYPVAYARDKKEFYHFLDEAVGCKLVEGKLDYTKNSPRPEEFEYRLTLEGWEHLSELDIPNSNSNQIFVAMWLPEKNKDSIWYQKMKMGWENVYLKIEDDPDYPYTKCYRADLEEHNNYIMNEIEYNIKNSACLISDLTGHRNGVYFEAGLARGYGLPVIFTCQEECFNDTHFDVAQINIIKYTADEQGLKELYQNLKNRIKQTIF